jgi:hypothetical protein
MDYVAITENAEANQNFIDSTKLLTVRSFLGANAIRATHSMDYSQIDWCSSNNSTVCALDHVTIPMLIAGMEHIIFWGMLSCFMKDRRAQTGNLSLSKERLTDLDAALPVSRRQDNIRMLPQATFSITCVIGSIPASNSRYM